MASSRLTVLPQPSCHTLGTRKPGRHFSHWEAHPHFTDRKLRLSQVIYKVLNIQIKNGLTYSLPELQLSLHTSSDGELTALPAM